MVENKGLYFIPIIDDALASDDPRVSLTEAFKKIHELGLNREYQEGFVQFQAFMKTIFESHLKGSSDRQKSIHEDLQQLIIDLITDTFESPEPEKKAMIAIFIQDNKWRAEYERIKAELVSFSESSPSIKIEVLKDDEPIASYDFSELPIHLVNIEPGQYTIRLSNGRVLWEGQLMKKDLIWAEAYGDEDLPMAAKTEDEVARPTISEPLLGGELIMVVLPGLKRGRIRISHGK